MLLHIQVQCYLPHWLFPIQVQLPDTPAVSPHLYILLYIQVRCYLPLWLFPHTCTYCCTYKCSVTCLWLFPHTCTYCCTYKCSVTCLWLFPHTCTYCCKYKCSVTWYSCCLPTPVHTVVHPSAVLSDSLPVSPHLYMLLYIQVQCYLTVCLFAHTCACCCTSKCSVMWQSACLPTPVHAVVHPSAALCDSLPVCPHLCMLLYIQVQRYVTVCLFAHTCACCCTSKCSVMWQSACLPTPVHAVVHPSAALCDSLPVCPHLCMLLYIQVQRYVTVCLFAHTCACCCTSKCSVMWQSACLPTPVHAVVHPSAALCDSLPVCPHLYMLLYIQVQRYLTVCLFAHTCTCCCTSSVMWQSACLPTPVHAVVHPSAALCDSLPVCPHLYMLLYIQVQRYLTVCLFAHTCTCCCTSKCSVIWQSACLPTCTCCCTSKCSVIWQSACLPTPVQVQVQRYLTVCLFAHTCTCCCTSAVLCDSLPVCPHLYMLLYIQVQRYVTVCLFVCPHTCTCCCTSKCSVIWQSACLPTPAHAVVHPSAVSDSLPVCPHLYMLLYIQVQRYLTVCLFAHTCTCCCTSKCSVHAVVHPSAALSDSLPFCPHLYMLLYKCSVMWQSACLPTPVHAVVHPSAVLSDSLPVCPHLYMLLYIQVQSGSCTLVFRISVLWTYGVVFRLLRIGNVGIWLCLVIKCV